MFGYRNSRFGLIFFIGGRFWFSLLNARILTRFGQLKVDLANQTWLQCIANNNE